MARSKTQDAYRREANRTIARLAQLETAQQPLQRTLDSYREEEAAKRQALAEQLLQQQSQMHKELSTSLQRSDSLSDVHRGLDELKADVSVAKCAA